MVEQPEGDDGGKSVACVLEPLYNIHNPKFEAVIFRRLYRELVAPGGLMTRAHEFYPAAGGIAHGLTWVFPSGAKVRFAHMQYEKDVESWKSSEIALIEVDEATEMSEFQFFYLFSRNRSISGVTPYMRGYTNPSPDSWLKVLLAPWVDDTWPADDRAESGEIRYFVRRDDVIQWVDKHTKFAISLTFVRADLYDNKILVERDPGYEAGLNVLPEYERRRLLLGDWNARPSGRKFKREWFTTYFEDMPRDIEKEVRGWDKAATAKKKRTSLSAGPDYTASVRVARRKEGCFPRYVIIDANWEQLDPGGVEELIRTTAIQDGHDVRIRIEQEGGSSGKQDIFNFVTKVLEGYDAEGIPSSGSKELRADTFAAQCKVGNVGIMRGWWNNGYLNFLCAFPDEKVHDDPVDATSLAFNQLYIMMSRDPSEQLADIQRRAALANERKVVHEQGSVQDLVGPPQKKKAWWEV